MTNPGIQREMSLESILDQAEAKLEEKHGILSLDICKRELEPHYQTIKALIAAART